MSQAPLLDNHCDQATVANAAAAAIWTNRQSQAALSPCFNGTWVCKLTLAFLLAATQAMASVTISQPSNGSTLTSPVQFAATSMTTTCTRGVAAMGVYVDNKLIYVSYGHKLSVQLPFKVGRYQTVVEEWDRCGGASYTRRIITVSSGSPPPPPPPPPGGHEVELSWDPPASSAVAVVGYNVYRSLGGTDAFQLLNPSLDADTSYTDSTVVSGQSYDYVIRSVGSDGAESDPSSILAVTIP